MPPAVPAVPPVVSGSAVVGGPFTAGVLTGKFVKAFQREPDSRSATIGRVAAGAATGAALGAAIGSAIPGLGTAAGAVIGGICGAIGGWLS